jgi:beta-lactamase regulating signal transducer with metallopeptidase domain
MTAADLVLEGLLNGLVHGLAVAGAGACLVRLVPARCAAFRYAVLYACLLLAGASPVMHVISGAAGRAKPVGEPPAGVSTPLAAPQAAAAPPGLPVRIPGGPVAGILICVWLTGAAFLGAKLAESYRHLRHLKRESDPPPASLDEWSQSWQAEFPTKRKPAVRISSKLRLPVTAGLGKPAILFPGGMARDLTEREARYIWLHETAHISRWDDWTNLVQKLIEAALFFHPGVRWIGRRLELEREVASDAWVVACTGAPKPYAACLARLAVFASERPGPAAALSMAANRQQVIRRIEMLTRKPEQRALPAFLAGAVLAILLGTVSAMALTGPIFVLASAPDEETAAAVPPEPPSVPVLAEPVQPATGSQQPAPPAPPAPTAPPPSPPPAPQAQAEDREPAAEMRPETEEIRRLTEEIRREVQTNVRARTEEIRKLTEQIRERIDSQIRPSLEEIDRLKRQLEERAGPEGRDEEAVRKLEQRIREIEEKALRKAEAGIRDLEKQIRAHADQIRPSEETIRRLEEKIRAKEEKLREREKKLRQRGGGAPEAPPAAHPR